MLSAAIFSGDDGLPHIERCLDSLKPLACEIVFVDTSISRKITEIVKKYTSNIYHEPWRNDFSYHRTHSFALCTGKWILQIDADEELIFNDRENGPDLFLASLNTAEKEIHGISLVMRDWNEKTQSFLAEHDVIRIFKKNKVTWKRRVHNRWSYPGKSASFKGVHLVHYGYNLTPEQKEIKAKRTIGLLKESLKDDPADYDCYFYLAQAYGGFEDNPEKALKYCKKYISFKDKIDPKEFYSSIYHLMITIYFIKKDYESAEKIIQQALENDNMDLDILYDWIQYGVNKKKPKIIAAASQRFIYVFENLPELRKKTHGRFYFYYNIKAYSEALYYLSVSHLESGVIELNKLKSLFNKLPQNQTNILKENLKDSLSQLKIKGLIDESKIITNLNNPNQMLSAAPRLKAL